MLNHKAQLLNFKYMKIVKGTKAIVAVLFVAFISLSIFWIMQSVMVLSNRKHQIFTDCYKELVATHFFEGIDTLDTSPIKVTECKISKSTDYLSHRDVIVKVKNVSDKPIKYIMFSLDYYNRVGDKINLPNYLNDTYIIIGTIPPNETNKDCYCATYACREKSAECVALTNIVIVFNDGTKFAIPASLARSLPNH